MRAIITSEVRGRKSEFKLAFSLWQDISEKQSGNFGICICFANSNMPPYSSQQETHAASDPAESTAWPEAPWIAATREEMGRRLKQRWNNTEQQPPLPLSVTQT